MKVKEKDKMILNGILDRQRVISREKKKAAQSTQQGQDRFNYHVIKKIEVEISRPKSCTTRQSAFEQLFRQSL